MKDAIRVILFEDNPKFSESLELYFDGSNTIYMAACFPNAIEALTLIRQHRPDVVLMDIEMPGISGIEAMQQIKKSEPDTKILIQTAFQDDHKIFAAMCAGASGYVLKSAGLEATENAIYDVHAGGGYFSPAIASKVITFFQNNVVTSQVEYVELTPTEKKVLQCMADGLSYKMIEDRLNKNYHAVHFHIKNIYKKLHVNSMTEAVVKALKNHLI
ncbi:response regulator transcription factor [Flavilitoribacter nigricans]|uniref:DNA-binding response regulator n=1 Tax=Flavilitoribacter nigricans (strain ATCC 23147 / DSM 23189 / NBRC 102662 / NCIMB 1420 / SS-2) TaxID=1122177 RepID=A0A2D0N6Y9_FLAN2|nr:response regulator transcription factor [Flavilitoribacter nigricans]PHN04146.1 DNA-binding response regulator [Flavilitoribacter nigricans DSM 23189 = NBRC 102662]